MFGFIEKKPAMRKGYNDCSGCSLCLLVCPAWRQSRDISLTPHGHAKAMQHGISAADVAVSAKNCILCMACEPVCPEQIDIVGMILELRRQSGAPAWLHDLQAKMDERAARPATLPPSSPAMLLPDRALHAHPAILARISSLLGNDIIIPMGDDDGSDISLALESGAVISKQRMERFLESLRQLKKIIVADGLLLRHLRQWLPNVNTIGLGEALSGHADVRRGLRPTDLYVIEPRAYHTDYQRLVKYYDRLRIAHGCAFNLDLQRIAIPATSRSLPQRLGLMAIDNDEQARWVLHRRGISRIVVESMEDKTAIEKVSDVPVVHLAELVDDGHYV